MAVERVMEKLTWSEFDDRITEGIDAVLLPIGTIEQHGRHMPLDTDCVIAKTGTGSVPLIAPNDRVRCGVPCGAVAGSDQRAASPESAGLARSFRYGVVDAVVRQRCRRL